MRPHGSLNGLILTPWSGLRSIFMPIKMKHQMISNIIQQVRVERNETNKAKAY